LYLFKCSSLQVSAFEAGQVTCFFFGDNLSFAMY
jgi:hypothetical protein